jgi:WD40 repeat protein
LKLDKKGVKDFAFSTDGNWLAVVSYEDTVRIWDTRTWTERSALAWRIGRLKCLAFSPDGTRTACGSHNGTILIWDWE